MTVTPTTAEIRLAPGLVLEDDWYAVQAIDTRTFAFGEPRYHQQNWSYLLIGDERSLLFDTGSFRGDITAAVARRARGALTALPSHMHFDHLGNVARFDRVAVADLPMLRTCVSGGRLTPVEELFLGAYEGDTAPTFAVAEWLAPGSEIDLGERHFRLIHTPGHSTDSISLYSDVENRLFAADFIYPGELYAQVPGADLPTYLEVTERLLNMIDEETEIFCAHGNAGAGDLQAAPVLQRADLEALQAGLMRIRDEAQTWADAPEWRVELSERLALLVGPQAVAAWRAS